MAIDGPQQHQRIEEYINVLLLIDNRRRPQKLQRTAPSSFRICSRVFGSVRSSPGGLANTPGQHRALTLKEPIGRDSIFTPFQFLCSTPFWRTRGGPHVWRHSWTSSFRIAHNSHDGLPKASREAGWMASDQWFASSQ